MPTLMYCNACSKHVVFGDPKDANSQRYNETAFIIGGVTITSKCPKCRNELSERKG